MKRERRLGGGGGGMGGLGLRARISPHLAFCECSSYYLLSLRQFRLWTLDVFHRKTGRAALMLHVVFYVFFI